MKISSTRLVGHAMAMLTAALATPFGAEKAAKIRGMARTRLASVVPVHMGPEGVEFQLTVLDRNGAYWPFGGVVSEPETVRWLDTLGDGEVLYDIGANIGLYSLYAAIGRGCVCVPCEPNPFSFDALVRNVLLNQAQDRIFPLCVAAGNEDGVFRLGISSLDSGAVGSVLSNADEPKARIAAVVMRLDCLVRTRNLPFPNHLKIDIDGIESLVLEGAAMVLSDPRLRSLLIEVCGRSPEEMRALRSLAEIGGLRLSEQECARDNWVFRRG